jgi:hypothetical protein
LVVGELMEQSTKEGGKKGRKKERKKDMQHESMDKESIDQTDVAISASLFGFQSYMCLYLRSVPPSVVWI